MSDQDPPFQTLHETAFIKLFQDMYKDQSGGFVCRDWGFKGLFKRNVP